MSRWLSYRPPAPFIPAGYRHPRLDRESRHSRPARHPRLDRGSLRRQRLQHRALAASQPCTGKCALTLQPTAALHHRHPRLNRGPRRAFGRARGEPLGGGAPRSAQPPETAYSGGGAKIRLSPRGIICQCQSPLTIKFQSQPYLGISRPFSLSHTWIRDVTSCLSVISCFISNIMILG